MNIPVITLLYIFFMGINYPILRVMSLQFDPLNNNAIRSFAGGLSIHASLIFLDEHNKILNRWFMLGSFCLFLSISIQSIQNLFVKTQCHYSDFGYSHQLLLSKRNLINTSNNRSNLCSFRWNDRVKNKQKIILIISQ